MKKLLTLALALMLGNMVAMAIPAYPVKKTLKLADGSLVTATLRGDEFMSYYQLEDGRRMRLEDETLLPISDFEFALMKGAAQQTSSVNQQRRVARVKRNAKYLGKKRGLVILVEFADNEFSITNPQETYNNFFNQEGYTDHGMTGSVSDYFKAQSYGQFELDFDIVGPYKLKSTMAYYGAHQGEKNDNAPEKMIVEAVTMANPDVNYKDYDWDGDGEVDQVFVVYAGYGEASGASPNTIWPHEHKLQYTSNVLSFDGVKIDTYACSCELSGTSGTTLDGIGTACHEFSHCLGHADHYDTAYGGNFGMSYWDLMDRGSNNNGGRTPAAYTAYERWVCGWLEPVEVTSKTQVTGMKPLVDAPEAYILYNDGNRNEYYILENRQQKGFDAALYGHGLLVVHVDYDEGSWKLNNVNVGDVQHMTIIAADGEYGYYYSSSMAGDPFPGSKNVTELKDYTTPSARLNNKNTDKSYLMHKNIECIKEDAQGLISMLVCAEPLGVPAVTATDVTSTSFRLSWDKVQDAESYEIYLDEVAKRADVKDALVLSEDFSSCYSKSAGFTDISAKDMAKYLTGYSGSRLFTTPDYLRIGTSTTAGYLYTPVLKALATGDLTIVMKVKPLKAGTAVKGEVKITTNTAETRQSFDLNFDQESTLVFHSYTQFNEVFRVDIVPTGAMYISGLYLYDGNFTDEELGITSSNKSPKRAHIKTITTTNNYYDFTGLNPNSVYSVKMRSLTTGRSSEWSGMYTIVDPTSIQVVQDDAIQTDNAWYDLSGRRILAPTRGLYIHDGKKVVLK